MYERVICVYIYLREAEEERIERYELCFTIVSLCGEEEERVEGREWEAKECDERKL